MKTIVLWLLATSLTAAAAPPPPLPFRPPYNMHRFPPITSFNLDPKKSLDTSVRISAREGRLRAMRGFIARGGDLNSRSGRLMTALMYASRDCRRSIVKYLLKNGAEVNARDSKGRTALMFAAGGSCLPVVKLLVSFPGLDLNLKDRRGRKAYDYAVSAASLDVGGTPTRTVNLIRRAMQSMPK